MTKNKNDNLNIAQKVRNNEFYTYYEDIEKELKNYTDYFENKVVLLNCDDANEEKNNFTQYFLNNFNLKKLISVRYNPEGKGFYYSYEASNMREVFPLYGNGSFESEECLSLLRQSDIVITNPPFSRLKDFIPLLIKYNKDFLIIGNQNALKYKDIFPLICQNRVRTGYNKVECFKQPDGSQKRFGNVCWITTLPVDKSGLKKELTKEYDSKVYLKYDNYDAINVDKLADIPKNYDGEMGVPITILDGYDPEQFEIIGKISDGVIGSRNVYERILIKNKI